MAFFEPTAPRAPLPAPPWLAPPVDAVGSAVPLQRFLVRTGSMIVALTSVVAYPSGCRFSFRVAARVLGRSRADHRRLRAAFLDDDPDPGEPSLSDEPFRCGIQFADGTKVTSADPPPLWDPTLPARPEGPVLVEHRSLGTTLKPDGLWCDPAYWLWPLPPPQPFVLVVDWPAAGVRQTEVELDGAEIVAAGEAAKPFWPDEAQQD